MIKTSGGAPTNADAKILFDLRQNGMGYPVNTVSTSDAVQRLVKRGGEPSYNGAPDFGFWGCDGNQFQQLYPLALQRYAGNTAFRPTSRTNNDFTLSCQWAHLLAGWNPAADLPMPLIPAYQQHEIEVTIAKQSTDGFMLFSLSSIGSVGAYYNPSSIGAMGLGFQSNTGESTVSMVRYRVDPTGGASITNVAIAPVECVAAAITLKISVAFGPALSVQFWINGQLVVTLGAAELAWQNLNAPGDLGNFILTPRIDVFAGGAPTRGIYGPYYSRATIREV